jgi:hypothetical protein
VFEDDLSDLTRQSGGEESVSHSGNGPQARVWDLSFDGLAVRQRAERVLGAMNDQCRRRDRGERDQSVLAHLPRGQIMVH